MRHTNWSDHLLLKFVALCGLLTLLAFIPSLEKPTTFILQTIGGLLGTVFIVGGLLAVPLLVFSFVAPRR